MALLPENLHTAIIYFDTNYVKTDSYDKQLIKTINYSRVKNQQNANDYVNRVCFVGKLTIFSLLAVQFDQSDCLPLQKP